MLRMMVVAMVSIGLVAPAFAQSAGSGQPGLSVGGQTGANGVVLQSDGLQALAQANDGNNGGSPPPSFCAPGDPSCLLIIGGLAGGAGLLAYALSHNNQNNTPVSP